tara:strand:+ start:811 stop:1143 length:333 start_codon:yes stop_codon:yes gene_type:complete
LLGLTAVAVQAAKSFWDQNMLAVLEQEYGPQAQKRGQALLALIEKFHDKDRDIQLAAVNKFFNRFPYVSDSEMWQQEDYWATPTEFLGRKGGGLRRLRGREIFYPQSLGH